MRPPLHERNMFSIDHLGIAVKSLVAAKAFYEKLGLSVSPEETVEHERVRLVMVPTGESRLELLEATSEDSTIAKFIAKRGEGLHHICLEVDDIDAALQEMQEKGAPVLDKQPRIAAEGRAIFLHPKGTSGVLLELLEKRG